VFGVCDQLCYHSLYDTYVSIERTTYDSPEYGHVYVHGKAYYEKGGNGTKTAHDQDRLPS
jgi:hypothetical protein